MSVVTGPPAETGRLSGLDEASLESLHRLADENRLPLLIEADGSRQRPLKAPGDHEPAIPVFVDLVVVVAGLSGLSKPLNSNWVHRPAEFEAISGLHQGQEITEQAVARALVHEQGGQKNILTGMRRVALLNQADDPESQGKASALAGRLLPTYAAVLIASLEGLADTSQIFAVKEKIAGIVRAGVPRRARAGALLARRRAERGRGRRDGRPARGGIDAVTSVPVRNTRRRAALALLLLLGSAALGSLGAVIVRPELALIPARAAARWRYGARSGVVHVPTAGFGAVDVAWSEVGEGRLVLLVHGLGGESTALLPLARELARHGYRAVVLDLPGCGRSPRPPRPLGIDSAGAYALGAAEALGLGPRPALVEMMQDCMVCEPGFAYLNVYDVTQDQKYLDAAKRLARAYADTQLPSGGWPYYVNAKTGEQKGGEYPPALTVLFFDRLATQYGIRDFVPAADRAFQWILDNQVKTFDHRAHFWDVRPRTGPGGSQGALAGVEIAMCLFGRGEKDPRYIALGEEYLKRVEDQFIWWEEGGRVSEQTGYMPRIGFTGGGVTMPSARSVQVPKARILRELFFQEIPAAE